MKPNLASVVAVWAIIPIVVVLTYLHLVEILPRVGVFPSSICGGVEYVFSIEQANDADQAHSHAHPSHAGHR